MQFPSGEPFPALVQGSALTQPLPQGPVFSVSATESVQHSKYKPLSTMVPRVNASAHDELMQMACRSPPWPGPLCLPGLRSRERPAHLTLSLGCHHQRMFCTNSFWWQRISSLRPKMEMDFPHWQSPKALTTPTWCHWVTPDCHLLSPAETTREVLINHLTLTAESPRVFSWAHTGFLYYTADFLRARIMSRRPLISSKNPKSWLREGVHLLKKKLIYFL